MDLKEEIILGKSIHNHWYYLSKALAIKKLLKGETEKKIIDIGSGSGFFSEFFIKSMNFSEAWCVDISYEREYEKIINNKKIYFRKSIQNIESKLVLMLDVIEHIEDDAKFLESYVENSLPGTKFVISVPAFQLLWSNHDEFLEHKRRYTLFEIENLIKKSGLTIKYSSYFFGIIFPCVLAIRFLKKLKMKNKIESDLKRYPLIVNYILQKLCSLEINFMRFNKIAGVTILCVAEKNKE